MKDHIYVIDPRSNGSVAVEPTTFFELKIRERQDLQQWLIDTPRVLGEPLFVITSEFDRFDKSDKRLDILFLDQNATIVVAELKLDATGSLADLQVIRYGAFCSTMTMRDVVDLCARASSCTREEAESRICKFLDTVELPELNGEPRMILAAGSFNDQELTATVLWLRKLGLDLTCVELTPYRYPGDDERILLVPRVLIPLAEARDYQIGVERKTKLENSDNQAQLFSSFFADVIAEYTKLQPLVDAPKRASTRFFMPMYIRQVVGERHVHYEWVFRRRDKAIGVELHFEAPDQVINLGWVDHVLTGSPNLTEGITRGTSIGAWGTKWARIGYLIPYDGPQPGERVAHESAVLMDTLIRRTLPAVKSLSRSDA